MYARAEILRNDSPAVCCWSKLLEGLGGGGGAVFLTFDGGGGSVLGGGADGGGGSELGGGADGGGDATGVSAKSSSSSSSSSLSWLLYGDFGGGGIEAVF